MDDLARLRLELKAVTDEIRGLEAESPTELDSGKTDRELERDVYVTIGLMALRRKEEELSTRLKRLTQMQGLADSAAPQVGGTQQTAPAPRASGARAANRQRRSVRVSVPAAMLDRLDSMALRVGVDRNALIQMAVFQAVGADLN